MSYLSSNIHWQCTSSGSEYPPIHLSKHAFSPFFCVLRTSSQFTYMMYHTPAVHSQFRVVLLMKLAYVDMIRSLRAPSR